METSRTPKSYLTHIPVRSPLEADALSKESTWNILRLVRQAGAQGASADEFVKSLRLPPSAVYSTLKELRRLEFVSVLPHENKRKGERKRRFVCERTTWGKYRIDGAFLDAINYEGITEQVTEGLGGALSQVLGRLFDEFGKRPRLLQYLPVAEEGRICPICGRNHEASDFAFAVVLAALDAYITESAAFLGLLRKNAYAR